MKLRTALALAASMLVGSRFAIAQELAPYQIQANGQQYEIRMGTAQRALKAISVYFISPGNISHAASVEVMGPVGIRGTAQGGPLGSMEAPTALAGGVTLQQYAIRTYPDKKEATSFATASAYDPMFGSSSSWFHLSKDACGKKTDQYVAQVKLDLTGIDPAAYDKGFSIYLAVKESKYPGKPVASIKPSSDGKYFGEPILLMNTVGYGGEYVNKVTWKAGRIVATKRLPVVKYVGYMGYALSLTRIKGVLQGGKHTWELSDGGNIYGVCLQATRKRQRVNGYPGGK